MIRAAVELDGLADWSSWVPFGQAVAKAPTQPGVYLAREGATGLLVYVGMAGERRGLSQDGKPKGIRGRLAVYGSGKGLVSGLGEAVLDRALADVGWLRERLAELEAGQSARAKAWGRMAFERAQLEVRWAVTDDKASARVLELEVLHALRETDLWNRAR